MNTSPKIPRDTAPVEAANDKVEAAFEAVTALFNKGIERMAQLQKSALDLAAEHNADAVEISKKFFQLMPNLPGAFLFDLEAQAVAGYVAAQKSLWDVVVEQNAAMAEFVTKARREPAAKATGALGGMFQQSVERGLAAQKNVLDIATQHSRAATEIVKQQAPGTPAAMAADSMQRGVDTFIETQKELLDIASQPVKAVAGAA